jgi:hypothetical protein
VQACRALLGGMGQVLLIVRPGVDCQRLPSGQSDASTSTARARHIDIIVLQPGCTEIARKVKTKGRMKGGMKKGCSS